MTDERWANTKKLCRGFASYYGPCGDPYCSDCYPGGQVCTTCNELRGDCECDACPNCGANWIENHEQYCICPFCSCVKCGEYEKDCKCFRGPEKESPELYSDYKERLHKKGTKNDRGEGKAGKGGGVSSP